MTEREIVACTLYEKDSAVHIVRSICEFKKLHGHDPRLDAEDTIERVLGLALNELRILASNGTTKINKQKRSDKAPNRKRIVARQPK